MGRSKARRSAGWDILEPTTGVAQYRWSSLLLCLVPYPEQAVYRNNDWCMITRDHAEAAFLGDVTVAHYRIIFSCYAE